MDQKILKAYGAAPKTWLWQLLAAFIVACLLAWSGTAVRVSNPTSNGLEVAGNIISGIFHRGRGDLTAAVVHQRQ